MSFFLIIALDRRVDQVKMALRDNSKKGRLGIGSQFFKEIATDLQWFIIGNGRRFS